MYSVPIPAISKVIDDVQNDGDGSLNEYQWEALKDFRDAAVGIVLLTRRILNALGLDEEGNTRK